MINQAIEVGIAQPANLEALVWLFDQYRVFYQQDSDLAAATAFLQERLQNQDSVIFLATDQERPVGFTQLYPSFSSVSMRRLWILNDLFVAKSDRQRGVAKMLMQTAEGYARQTGAVRLILATQISNSVAQALYESLGYSRDQTFYHYSLTL